MKSRSSSSIYGSEKVALVYNEGMLSHKPLPDLSVEEIPERLSRIIKKLKEGLWKGSSKSLISASVQVVLYNF